MDLTAELTVLPLLFLVLPSSFIEMAKHVAITSWFLLQRSQTNSNTTAFVFWCFHMLGLETKVWPPLCRTLVTYCDLRNHSCQWTVVALLPSWQFFWPLCITTSVVSFILIRTKEFCASKQHCSVHQCLPGVITKMMIFLIVKVNLFYIKLSMFFVLTLQFVSSMGNNWDAFIIWLHCSLVMAYAPHAHLTFIPLILILCCNVGR